VAQGTNEKHRLCLRTAPLVSKAIRKAGQKGKEELVENLRNDANIAVARVNIIKSTISSGDGVSGRDLGWFFWRVRGDNKDAYIDTKKKMKSKFRPR